MIDFVLFVFTALVATAAAEIVARTWFGGRRLLAWWDARQARLVPQPPPLPALNPAALLYVLCPCCGTPHDASVLMRAPGVEPSECRGCGMYLPARPELVRG